MTTGSITSAGLGSGIDIESLITRLVSLERTPITQLQAKETSFQARLSAFGTLKSSLSSLKDAAEALATRDKFAARSATIADAGIATVTASSSAKAGSYSLEVDKLAQGQKVRSAGLASASSSIATGTLNINLGNFNGTTFTADPARSFNIVIDSSNNTLAGLRDAINAAKTGVTASLVNDGSLTRLVLTSDSTGANNAFRLSGLTGYDFNPAGASTLLPTQNAQDAEFTLDGIDIKRSSNTFSDVLDGVSFTLKKETTAATSLAVSSDNSAMLKQINAFVSAYNNSVGLMSSQTSYNATTKTGGPLNGENSVRSIQSQLRSIMGSSVGNNASFARLADVGINIGVDGKLSVNSSKLESALNDPTKDVASLFISESGTSGFAAKISERITSILGTDGTLTARTDGISKTMSGIDAQVERLEKRLTVIEARYRAQFTAMDSMLASLNNTSTFLNQQLSALSAS